MRIPFTTEDFLNLFEDYNRGIWPAQIVAYVLAAIAILAAVNRQSRITNGALALFWLWNGVAYQLLYFRLINGAAVVFGALFIVQGLLFLAGATSLVSLQYSPKRGVWFWIGGALIAYAAIVYPLLSMYLGHGFPRSPAFGVAPCPMVIFSIGMLMWTKPSFSPFLLIVPVGWSILGASAALQLGMREDLVLPLAGFLVTVYAAEERWAARHIVVPTPGKLAHG